ncbi:hypothetical protein [Pseudoxanthomonas sp. LARHCG66]
MKHYLALLVSISIAPATYARGVEVCPTLPVNAGLEWTYHEGPDFDVCYAAKPGSEANAFGVYLGNHPSFKPKDAVRIGKGRVANKKVIWYQQDPEDSSSAFGQQTLIVLDKKYGYVAHVWVAADTNQELQDRLSVLERITFKP